MAVLVYDCHLGTPNSKKQKSKNIKIKYQSNKAFGTGERRFGACAL